MNQSLIPRSLAWALLTILAVLDGPATAGGGPENVVVVVNQESWASQTIANHYVALRNIPPNHVIYLKDIDSHDQMDVERFRTTVLEPVLDAIKSRGLTDQIDIIAYSADFPYAINVRGDVKDLKLPKVLTPTGSLNGMTYLADRVLARNTTPGQYLQLNANRYFRKVGSTLPPLPPTAAEPLKDALALLRSNKAAEAETALRKIAKASPHHPMVLYNLACSLAKQEKAEKADEAIKQLQLAVKHGWPSKDAIARDNDLESLRERDDFKQLLASVSPHFETQPSQAFRHHLWWDAQGASATSQTDGSERYYLSTMLAMTSGRGNSVDEAIRCLESSVRSDDNPPQGVIYFPTNGNVRSRTRDMLYPSVVSQLQAMGVGANTSAGIIPQNKQDVAGAMIGTATFHWESSGSRILPGAICEHLTSFGGVLREAAGQTPLTEFIRHGAAGSSGTVTEPYAIQAKFPVAFLHVHYANGCNLAESFYQSVAGPYQLLIVGDPLCQPWAVRPTFTIDSPKLAAPSQPDSAKSAQTVFVVDEAFEVTGVPAKKSPAIASFEFFADGHHLGAAPPNIAMHVEVDQLTDGVHDLHVVAVADTPVAARRSKRISFRVDRNSNKVELTFDKHVSEDSTAYSWNDEIAITVAAEGAKKIAIFRNEQNLGTVDGASGKIKIAARDLGLGETKLTARGVFADSETWSEPKALQVEHPATLPASANRPKKLTDGLLLRWQLPGQDPTDNSKTGDNDTPTEQETLVDTTRPTDWLSKLKKPAGSRFESIAWFKVVESDAGKSDSEGEVLCQVQLRTNGQCEIEIDGVPILASKDADRWHYAPVVLAPGDHQMAIRGQIAPSPRLAVRFGRRGAFSLDQRFQHEDK